MAFQGKLGNLHYLGLLGLSPLSCVHSHMSQESNVQERLITYKEVTEICGLGRSTIYEWVQVGKFPKPLKLGAGPKSPVKFKLSEVMAFIDELPVQHY